MSEASWDDDEPDYEDEPREQAPMFGCACENPLVVDEVCPGCISILARQEREASK